MEKGQKIIACMLVAMTIGLAKERIIWEREGATPEKSSNPMGKEVKRNLSQASRGPVLSG